jgi:hypothetical protein
MTVMDMSSIVIILKWYVKCFYVLCRFAQVSSTFHMETNHCNINWRLNGPDSVAKEVQLVLGGSSYLWTEFVGTEATSAKKKNLRGVPTLLRSWIRLNHWIMWKECEKEQKPPVVLE